MFDTRTCIELIIALGAIAAMWVRLEHRLTKMEGRIQERYRDKKAVSDRIENVEKWLPREQKQS